MARKNPAAVALGRRGGKVKSAAKAAAVRRNGKKGGRPPNCVGVYSCGCWLMRDFSVRAQPGCRSHTKDMASTADINGQDT